MNIYQKLNELKKSVGGFYKDLGKGKGGTGDKLQYNYVSGNQILNAINDKCIELGMIFLCCNTNSNGWQEFHYHNSRGDEKVDFVVFGNAIFRWVNTDDPTDYIEIPFDYYGAQDDISKSYGSALTYSERYCLLKSLGLPTDEDDPDSRDTSDRYAKKNNHVDKTIKQVLSEKPFVAPTQESLDELEQLGGTLNMVAIYFKVNEEQVSEDMVKSMIAAKKKSLAKSGGMN